MKSAWPGQNLCRGRRRIGLDEDDSIELWPAAKVRRVGDRARMRWPAPHRTKRNRPLPIELTRGVRRVQLIRRNRAVYMFWNDDQLIGHIVELLRRALLEPHDGRQRVAHRDRIDVRERRRRRRPDFWIGEDLEAVANVGGRHRLAVMPPRTRIDREGDRQRVGRPGPLLREARRKSLVADGRRARY